MEHREIGLNEEEKFFLRSKNLSSKELLDNVDRFSRISFDWKNPDFAYLLEEPMRGWESAEERGLPVPEKPSDANLLLFVDYYIGKLKEQNTPEHLTKSLEYIKETLKNQTVLDSDTELVGVLYELDDFERFIKAQSAYIYEKNRAMGFVYDVILFSINRVREIINSKSLE
ncbi:MAG: hypothetical protein QG654_24 [Patescibacteria group bacterium]|nr:hypothetical protein [Patescibacteria group bacterium]